MNGKEPFEPPLDPPMFQEDPFVTWENGLLQLSADGSDVKNTPQN
jgi:hypothetical protein